MLRFFLLRAHYRSPINYSAALVDESREALLRLYNAVGDAPPAAGAAAAVDWSEAHAARFKAAMDDDFNTAEALAALFDLATRANRDDAPAAAQLRRLEGSSGCCSRIRTAYAARRCAASERLQAASPRRRS